VLVLTVDWTYKFCNSPRSTFMCL